MTTIRLLLVMLFSFLFSACDDPRELKPGISTGYEVRDRMGPPTTEWKNDNGTTTWEYPKGPEGKVTYMVTIGSDNILRAVEQVLAEPYFRRVENGMGQDEVRRLLGRPGKVEQLPQKNEEVWDWLFEGDNPLHRSHFHVHFDRASGKVVGTSRRVEQPGG